MLLVARDFPSETSVNYASPWAGAHYRPVPGSSPQALREANQAQRTYEFFKTVAANEPAAGVLFLKGVEHLEAPPPEYLDSQSVSNVYSHLDGFRHLSNDEVPAGVKWGVEYGTYVVNSPVYCAHMLRKFILKGGITKRYTLAHPKEAFSLATNVKTVVNCSGLGFEDPKSFIIRGMFKFNLHRSYKVQNIPEYTNSSRPNVPRPKYRLGNNHPPKYRRLLVLLHPAPVRRRYRHWRH